MRKIIIISSLLLLQACASQQLTTPNVTSNPAGATVYANGLDIGQTPLLKNLFDEFSAGWKGGVFSAQGVLAIKKAGCKDFTLKINDRILSKPIHAELECSEAIAKSQATIQTSAQPNTEPTPATTPDPETRLKKLESLYDKKLISEEEYNRTRERILNEI